MTTPIEALKELVDASQAFAADQSLATDKRCGLVQPVDVEECERLNAALATAEQVIAEWEKPVMLGDCPHVPIKVEDLGAKDREIARLRAQVEADALFIQSLTQPHLCCEDSWYSCPLHPEGCADDRETDCTCGATAWNKRIIDYLAAIEAAGKPETKSEEE